MSGRSRVLKRLDQAYAEGFEHGLTSSIPPNCPRSIETDLNKYIGWAYHAGARDGQQRAEQLTARPAGREHTGTR